MKRYFGVLFLFFVIASNINAYSVNLFDSDTIRANICNGESFNQYGFNENTTGVYFHNDTNYLGQDSITLLYLVVNPTYLDTIYADICFGDTYNENGFNQSDAGIYFKNDTSIYGCDSITILNLSVHRPYSETIFDTLCMYEDFFEFTIDSSGTYIRSLQTEYGCDSILTYYIHANPVYYDTIRADIYKGNTYNQHGFNEKETGIYEQKLQTELGCDSIIYLDLQVDNVLFPNVVTPNGDGVNDVFTLNNLVEQDAFPENELVVFNRQGKIIYRKTNIKSKIDFWDPALTKTPSGTYFYRFKGTRHDKTIDVTSSVEVLR